MTPFTSARDRPESHSAGFMHPRMVRIRLFDGRTLEGRMHVADGQSVVEFLGMRRSFVNLTDVRWMDGRAETSRLPHVGLRLSHLVWVIPLDPDLPLSSAIRSPETSRAVELTLVGDLVLQVRIQIADELRMSDYFDSHPDFIPLRSVLTEVSSEPIDRLAVQRDAIRTFREI